MKNFYGSPTEKKELQEQLAKGLCEESVDYLRKHEEFRFFEAFRDKFGEEALYEKVRPIPKNLFAPFVSWFSFDFLRSKGYFSTD